MKYAGDINFAPELSDLRYRFGFSVVILHGPHVNEALLVTSNAHYSFHQFLEDVPQKSQFFDKRVRFVSSFIFLIIFQFCK